MQCMLSISIHLAGVTDNALKAASVTQNHVLNAFTNSGEKNGCNSTAAQGRLPLQTGCTVEKCVTEKRSSGRNRQEEP